MLTACAWDGEAEARGGLAGRFSTTSSSRRQCWWWGRIWFISLTDSFYKLCQLSALSASILRLPEQTKTSATRGRGCQSRRKLVPPRLARVLAGRGLSNILPQSVLLFLTRLGGIFFEMCEDGGIYKRLAISCASWWMFF